MFRAEKSRAVLATFAPALVLLAIMLAGLLAVSGYGQYVLALGFVSMAIGAALVVLVGLARCITLASAAFMAIGSYTAALCVTLLGLPYLLSLALAVIVGAVAGWILALPGVRFRSHNLAMVTLVFQMVVMILIREATSITGGAQGMRVKPAELFGFVLEESDNAGYLLLCGIGGIVAVALLSVMVRGRFGKNLRSVAANEIGAEAFGIDIARYLMAAFVISSAVIAFAGGLAAPLVRIIDPDSYGVLASVFMLAYPIVGGMTSIWGGLTGGAAFRILPEVLRPVADYLDLIFAVLVILITMFLPGGLVDLIRRPFNHLRRNAAPRVETPEFGAAAETATLAGAGLALKISGVSRRFGALQAVDDVTLSIPAGAIHGIIGPNGAGKTSLFNIVSGFLDADAGDIEIFGQKALGLKARERIGLGMTRTFQHVALFPQLSCLDNVIAGLGRNTVMEALRDSFDEVVDGARSQEQRAWAMEALASVGLAELAHLPAGQQSLGNQRRLEIARAIVSRPRLILLDEPVSGVSKEEAGRLRELLLRINAETGVAMLLIEHNIGFVTDLCRTVSVMGNGRIVAEGEAHATVALPAVRRLYFGERDAA